MLSGVTEDVDDSDFLLFLLLMIQETTQQMIAMKTTIGPTIAAISLAVPSPEAELTKPLVLELTLELESQLEGLQVPEGP